MNKTIKSRAETDGAGWGIGKREKSMKPKFRCLKRSTNLHKPLPRLTKEKKRRRKLPKSVIKEETLGPIPQKLKAV